jgi:hypothetical protein
MSTWRPGKGYDFTGTPPLYQSRPKLTPAQRDLIRQRWEQAQEGDVPPVRWDFCKALALEFKVSVHTINGLL